MNAVTSRRSMLIPHLSWKCSNLWPSPSSREEFLFRRRNWSYCCEQPTSTHTRAHSLSRYVLWTNHWSTRGFPVSYISHIYSAWMTDKTIYTLPSSSSSAFSLNLWAISLFKKTQMKEIKDCPRLPAIGPGEYIGFDVILLIWSIYLWFTSALDCLFGSSCQVIDVFINFWEPNWCWAWIHLRLLISQRALRPHNERVAEETQKPERFRWVIQTATC